MRCVIFVNSYMGLITAIQIREYLYNNCEFDMVMSDLTPSLFEIYNNGVLKDRFDNIYFVSTGRYKRIYKYITLISPQKYLKKILKTDIKEYTDVFFWNPTQLVHNYIMHLDSIGINYKLHLYGDAIGSYVVDYPFETNLYRSKILNSIIRKRAGYRFIKELEYDYFVFAPQYISFETKRKIVEIPKINKKDIEYYNKIFGFDTSIKIDNKYIFMDKQHNDEFSGDDISISILKTINELVDKDDFIIKSHPRQNESVYSKNNLNVLKLDIPWEIYCFNNDIKYKIIISYGSSALFMPFIMFGSKYTSICIQTQNNFNQIFKKEFQLFLEKFSKENKNLVVVNDISQLPDVIRKLSDGKER